MDSDEEKRLLFYQEIKSDDGFDQMIEGEKENEGFDQESSEDHVEKMNEEKDLSSATKLREGKSKSKTNGASASASSVRVCDFCGRTFSSGKALGGHRRFHLQALKKMAAQSQEKVNNHHHHFHPPNNTLKIKPNSEDFHYENIKSNGIDHNSRSFRCCVCEKDFPSKKSLFGHMRSHPEREWRGMNPPFNDNALVLPSVEQKVEEDHDNDDANHNNGSSPSSLEEAVVVDLSLSCSVSWLQKDKRGRRSIGAAEAAHNLVFLSCYGNYLRLPPQEPPAATVIPLKKRKKMMIDIGSLSGKQNLNKEEQEGVKADQNNGTDNDDEIWKMKVVSLKKEKKMKNNKKKGQEIKSEEDNNLLIRTLKEEMKSQSYICNICNKSFSSFQALGGHRSKHNRAKNIVISTKGKELVKQREGQGEDEAGHKVCINGTLSISTGLSGEEGGGEEASLLISEEKLVSSNHHENNSNEEASQSGSKMLDFDLNEPYVTEQGETDKSAFYE